MFDVSIHHLNTSKVETALSLLQPRDCFGYTSSKEISCLLHLRNLCNMSEKQRVMSNCQQDSCTRRLIIKYPSSSYVQKQCRQVRHKHNTFVTIQMANKNNITRLKCEHKQRGHYNIKGKLEGHGMLFAKSFLFSH